MDDDKVLIAYFTWADNTVVNDPGSVDVDVTTSASVLAPGNTALLAGWIQEAVGGDLFSIQVEEPYSSDYDACLEQANDEKAAKARPGLSSHVENMEDYDTIILGFPNWWYTCPMAVFSLIEEYDKDKLIKEPCRRRFGSIGRWDNCRVQYCLWRPAGQHGLPYAVTRAGMEHQQKSKDIQQSHVHPPLLPG